MGWCPLLLALCSISQSTVGDGVLDVPLKQYQLNFRINALTLALSRWAREFLAGDGVLDVPLKQYQLNFRINALTLPSPVRRGYFLWDALIS